MPRLFIALDPPEEVKHALDRLCEGLPGVRWSDPQQFHLTLRFIGEVGQGTFYDIGEALAGVSHPPFELALRGLGQFPPRGAPHTLWVGVEDPSGALATLRRRIARTLSDVGLEPERRKFAPHVTLGRFRAPPPQERLASYLFRRNLFRSERFPVSSFGLYASQLRPEGSLYTLEAEYDFVAGVVERV
ncbi:MAG: RNA 2',3'-cyclic phosphodiesterase [Geminicoccaceae bacterium]